MSTDISQENRAAALNKQVSDLRLLRTNMKPSLAFIVGIAFILLGVFFVHGMFGILLLVLGVTGILAGVAAVAKRSGIDRQIVELEKQLEALK